MLKYFQQKMLNTCLQLSAWVIISAFTENLIATHSFYLFHSLRLQNVVSELQYPFTICKFPMAGNQTARISTVYLKAFQNLTAAKDFNRLMYYHWHER